MGEGVGNIVSGIGLYRHGSTGKHHMVTGLTAARNANGHLSVLSRKGHLVGTAHLRSPARPVLSVNIYLAFRSRFGFGFCPLLLNRQVIQHHGAVCSRRLVDGVHSNHPDNGVFHITAGGILPRSSHRPGILGVNGVGRQHIHRGHILLKHPYPGGYALDPLLGKGVGNIVSGIGLHRHGNTGKHHMVTGLTAAGNANRHLSVLGRKSHLVGTAHLRSPARPIRAIHSDGALFLCSPYRQQRQQKGKGKKHRYDSLVTVFFHLGPHSFPNVKVF